MLSSSGFFSDIVCPFFKTGLCERPHCHFKHSLPAVKEAKKPSYLSYTPTPLSKLRKHGISSSPAAKTEKNGSATVAEYTPTPISELKKLKDDVQKRKSSITDDRPSKKVKVENPETTIIEKQISEETKSVGNVVKETKHEKLAATASISKCRSSDDSESNSRSRPSSSSETASSSSSKDARSKLKETTVEAAVKPKRVAHPSASDLVTEPTKKLRPNAADVMFNRLKAIELAAAKSSSDQPSSSDESQPAASTGVKKRVAHAVSLDAIRNVKSKRPVMPLAVGASNKVPLAIRKQYMNVFIDEFLKCLPQAEAFEKGLAEEKTVYDKSANRKLYTSHAANSMKRIRAEHGMQKQITATVGNNKVVSHEMILNGPRTSNCSIVEKKGKKLKAEELSEPVLYSMLKKYLMKQETLKAYNYPMKDPEQDGCALLPPPDSKTLNNFLTRLRICFRCKKNFAVNELGVPVQKEACIYHNGRLWNERTCGMVTRQYSCCKGDPTTQGCASSDSHVVDGLGHPDYCKGYVATRPKKVKPDTCHGIYALDCEMCCTTIGMELTRVSVINYEMELVYETMVRPDNPILDYNTKFSGISESDLVGVKTTIRDVQKDLLKLFSESTILIGHSLESDLKALKLIHPTVVDTAEVFPHRRGLPFKRALRTLAAEHLQKIIQDNVAGHDSQEDAKSCMQLMLMKINNDLLKTKLKK